MWFKTHVTAKGIFYKMIKKVQIVAFVFLACGLCGCGDKKTETNPVESIQREEELVELTREQLLVQELEKRNASGLFLSEYDITAFSEEDFEYYQGEETVICNEICDSLNELIELLNVVLRNYGGLHNIYIGLDAANALGTADFEALWNALEAPEEMKVSIMFKSPSLSFLESKDEEYFAKIEETLCAATDFFEGKENVVLHYMGSCMWLVANDANYIDGQKYTDSAAQKVMLYTFVDGEYKVGKVNYEDCIIYAQELWRDYKSGEFSKGNLEGYTFVFVGDSIFARDRGAESIPSVVSNFTGALTYNCGRSGMSVELQEEGSGFLEAVYGLITGEVGDGSEDEHFAPSIEQFYRDFRSKSQDDKLVFVINLGINDYMSGSLLVNYKHTLRTGMQMLKMRYSNAQFVLITPNYISEMNGGTEDMGQGLELKDYATEMQMLAAEMEVLCLDIYNELGVNESSAGYYLSDGVHMSENGRFLYGQMLADFLNETFGVEDVESVVVEDAE